MTEAVIVAALTVLGQLVIAWFNRSALLARMEKQWELSDEKLRGEIAVIRSEIGALSARVEGYSRITERTCALERRCDVIEEKLRPVRPGREGSYAAH